MCFLSAQISSLLRDVLRYKHVKKTKNTRISNERERERDDSTQDDGQK